MFSKSAEFYDLIYRSFKDYAGESAEIASMIRDRLPQAKSVLDVACGTGEHAKHLSTSHGFLVDGIDLDAAMVEIARAKDSKGTYDCADMCDFSLDRSYDVILCLFSSIGYAKTLDKVVAAFSRFRNHLRPGGIIVVEPWFAPEDMKPGFLSMKTAEDDEHKVCRLSFNEIDGRISLVHFEYLIGGPGGIQHLRETHELGLFTRAEMEAAFRKVGFFATYDAEGLSGRGVWVVEAAG